MLTNAIDHLENVLCGVLWRQWAALGAPAYSAQSAQAVVDPEALILISLNFQDLDYRLTDMLAWFGRNRSKFISTQKIKNLIDNYPEVTRDHLAGFAKLAYEKGSDRRWRAFVSDTTKELDARQDKPSQEGRKPRTEASLMLRLRLAFGVGAKADILAVMISSTRAKTIRELAAATAYSRFNIHRAAADLVEAGLLTSGNGTPTKYNADTQKWRTLLNLEESSERWIYFSPIYSFILELIFLHREASNFSAYLFSSQLRDTVEKHMQVFSLNDIQLPNFSFYAGTEFLQAVTDITYNLGEWLNRCA